MQKQSEAETMTVTDETRRGKVQDERQTGDAHHLTPRRSRHKKFSQSNCAVSSASSLSSPPLRNVRSSTHDILTEVRTTQSSFQEFTAAAAAAGSGEPDAVIQYRQTGRVCDVQSYRDRPKQHNTHRLKTDRMHRRQQQQHQQRQQQQAESLRKQ